MAQSGGGEGDIGLRWGGMPKEAGVCKHCGVVDHQDVNLRGKEGIEGLHLLFEVR